MFSFLSKLFVGEPFVRQNGGPQPAAARMSGKATASVFKSAAAVARRPVQCILVRRRTIVKPTHHVSGFGRPSVRNGKSWLRGVPEDEGPHSVRNAGPGAKPSSLIAAIPDRPALRVPDHAADAGRRAPDAGPVPRGEVSAGADRVPAPVEVSERGRPAVCRRRNAAASEAEDVRPGRQSVAAPAACARAEPEADAGAADDAPAEAAESGDGSPRSNSGGRRPACTACPDTTSTDRPSGRLRSAGRCSRG